MTRTASFARRDFLMMACAGLAVTAASPFAFAAPTDVTWRIPRLREAVRRVENASIPEADMWTDRAITLMHAVWPAMEHVARVDGLEVDAALLRRMVRPAQMDEFARRFPSAPETAEVNRWLDMLPGYRPGGGAWHDSSIQQVYVVMQFYKPVTGTDMEYGALHDPVA